MYKKKGIQESEPEVTSFFPESDDGEWLSEFSYPYFMHKEFWIGIILL